MRRRSSSGKLDTSPLFALSFWIVAIAVTWWSGKRYGWIATVCAELAVGLFALTVRALLVVHGNPGAARAALLLLLAGMVLGVIAFATNTRESRQQRAEERELARRVQEAHAEWLQQRGVPPEQIDTKSRLPPPADAKPTTSQQVDAGPAPSQQAGARPRLSQLSEFGG